MAVVCEADLHVDLALEVVMTLLVGAEDVAHTCRDCQHEHAARSGVERQLPSGKLEFESDTDAEDRVARGDVEAVASEPVAGDPVSLRGVEVNVSFPPDIM